MKLGEKSVFVILIVCLVLTGCARTPKRVSSSSAFAPVPVSQVISGSGFYHTVSRGETIYRIAKNYGMDWHELARLNGIVDPSQMEVGQRIFVPTRGAQPSFKALPGPMDYDAVRRLVGAPRSRSTWRTITLHHSATKQGSAKAFNRDHTRRHMGGLFYHFVIGNGTSTGDGALEVGFRWKQQIDANRPDDIQICLVGEFNTQHVSESQFSTMVTLVKMLMQDYGIPLSGVRKHEDIKGKHTACPGAHFPFQRLLSEVSAS